MEEKVMKLLNSNSNILLLASISFFQPCQPKNAGKAGEKAILKILFL
jgi:hypothetical protein